MNNRYRSVKVGSRGGTFYLEDTQNGKRTSLRTKDHAEAQRLVHARNEADRLPQFNIRMGMAYMAASDPHVATRTWNDVMADIVQDKTGPTWLRWNTALKDKAFNLLRPQVLITTAPDDFMLALRAGTVSTNVYLRRLQNHAVDMGWLPLPILPKKKFPKIKHKEQRAIEGDEHRSIIARETNPERRDFYELCWHFGGSQSDIASLRSEDLDYERRCFVYAPPQNRGPGRDAHWRHRLGSDLAPAAGGAAVSLLDQRSGGGSGDRIQTTVPGFGISGVTLHSYRYAWAERSANAGYPERYAQRALGQNSKIVHRAYAKKA
ncbi:MAG TPA: hypothetical protein VL527_07465 [Dongiaceae bacterium]|nr:hypothetical protein [Dongiaceae bacterium]